MGKHVNNIRRINVKVGYKAFPEGNGSGKKAEFWAYEHSQAWTGDHPLVMMIMGLAQYADLHENRYESPIGEDGVLGEEWAQAVRAVRGLLNGDLNGLDGGTVDAILCDMLKAEGFEE